MLFQNQMLIHQIFLKLVTDTNNKGNQTVKVADTLKTAYIGYCIGIIVLIVGIAVLVQFYRKNKINNSEK